MAHEEGGEEAADHDKGPECARQEVRLFLFIFGSFFHLGRQFLRVGLALTLGWTRAVLVTWSHTS